MLELPDIHKTHLQDFLVELLNTPSPTGFSHMAIDVTEKALQAFSDVTTSITRKGGLVGTWPGESNDTPRALTAHVDTLGGMVKEIKGNGRLKISSLGGLLLNGVETEGCTIYTNDGKTIRGSFMLNNSSMHVYGAKVKDAKRTEDAMEIRLDEKTSSAEETRKLGIEVGNYIVFDPRIEVTNGFIRSRFLDDKAGVATLIAAVKTLTDAGLKPTQTTTLHISNYEEVGHGAAAGFPDDLAELVAIDMAAIGAGQTSDEFHATLCVKDSGGPYHHGLSNHLRQLAEENSIAYKTDIYPYYGSDGEAYWRAGGDVAVALIGPGVDASHNYERTHMDALIATTQWIMAYLLS